MRPAETFYQTLLDNLYDGVYFADKDRNITYWNHGAEGSGKVVVIYDIFQA